MRLGRRSATAEPVSRMAVSIGRKIYIKRLLLGWPQHKLAKRAKISVTFLCEIENGKARIAAERLYRVARALDVDMNYFFPEDTT